MTLILVRHAESTGNSGSTIQGWTDTELTEAGRSQAAAVARRLSRLPLAAVYASPLARARDTALAVAGLAGLEVVQLDDLRERYYGQAQETRVASATRLSCSRRLARPGYVPASPELRWRLRLERVCWRPARC